IAEPAGYVARLPAGIVRAAGGDRGAARHAEADEIAFERGGVGARWVFEGDAEGGADAGVVAGRARLPRGRARARAERGAVLGLQADARQAVVVLATGGAKRLGRQRGDVARGVRAAGAVVGAAARGRRDEDQDC